MTAAREGATKPTRFLDLPAEVRYLIYQYCYDSVNLTLRSGNGREIISYTNQTPRKLKLRTIMLGLPTARIHQVSRLLALEAGPIWEAKSSSLTIKNAAMDDNNCISDFTFARTHTNLRERLVTLDYCSRQYIMSDAGIPWHKLVVRCPRLRVVNVIVTEFQETSDPW